MKTVSELLVKALDRKLTKSETARVLRKLRGGSK